MQSLKVLIVEIKSYNENILYSYILIIIINFNLIKFNLLLLLYLQYIICKCILYRFENK